MHNYPSGCPHDHRRHRVELHAQPLRIPPTHLMGRERQETTPGLQVPGQGDDGQPDPILVEALQQEVGQTGVFGDANPILTPRSRPVSDFEISQLAVAKTVNR